MVSPPTADFVAAPVVLPIALADFNNPLFWAVMVGWIMTVVLHEFAHGVVGYWGGDYTVAERGGLSLNPLQYVDPVTSLLMPAIFLLVGGIGLPGGVTYIRRDLLRSKWWDSGVSLAGPTMNVLLFVIGAIVLHPRTGWVLADVPAREWTPGQQVVAALTFLQLFAALLNMLPVPPLDGFGVIGPFLKPETRYKLMTPPTSIGLIFVTFVLIMSPAVQNRLDGIVLHGFGLLGYDSYQAGRVRLAMDIILFGR